MSRPLVTVAIPFRNPGLFIKDAIQSVYAQTLQDWELILIDDGSTDVSVELAESVKDLRVRVLRDGNALGLVARLNQVPELARGKYIARMDADDIMHPCRLEKQIDFLDQHKNIQVVDTGAYVLDSNRNPVGVRGLDNKQTKNKSYALTRGVVLHASVMGRSEWFFKHRYDERYPRAEDRELYVRVLDSGVIDHIPEPLLFHYYVGNVRVEAFLESYASERKVLLKYGPNMVGLCKTYFFWFRSLAKSCVLPILVATGHEDIVTRSAYRIITEEQAAQAKELLKKVRTTKVPGW